MVSLLLRAWRPIAPRAPASLAALLSSPPGAPMGAGRDRSTAATTSPAPSAPAAPATLSPAEQWARAKPYRQIPGPKYIPLLSEFFQLFPVGPFKNMDLLQVQIKLQEEFGDLVRISNILGKKDVVMVFSPEIAENMLRNEGKWPIREGIETLHYYRTQMRTDTYGDAIGIITSNGKLWHDFRSKVNQPLMRSTSARRYTGQINDVSEEFIARIKMIRDDRKELPADFIKELHKWALESITLVALDKRLGCLQPNLSAESVPQKMIDSIHVIFDAFYYLDVKSSLWRYFSTPLWRRFIAANDYFNEVAESYVKEAIQNSMNKKDGELSVFQEIMKRDPNVAKVMAFDMIFGGVDTTSSLTASVLFHLAKTPDAQQKLGEELRRVLPKTDSPITAEVLDELTYLKASVKESSRIFPITTGTSRQTQGDIVLGDYQIPKGVNVLLGHMVMSRDERNYPRPMSFEPERWLRGSAHAHDAHPFTTLPFGFGPRSCVGRRFAEMEVHTLVAKIIRNFWVEYHYDEEIKFEARTTNVITSPLKFRLIEHST